MTSDRGFGELHRAGGEGALEEAIPVALGEAKRRWGPDGHVFLEDASTPSRCLVGRAAGHTMQVLGKGSTWQEAFADAEKADRTIHARALWPF
jgi:hypothetical protein